MSSTNHTATSHEPSGTTNNSSSRDRRSVLGENLLTIVTIIGVIGGTIFGLILKKSDHVWTERDIMYIQYPGDLFLRMLKCLIVPLLVASITSAIGALDLSLSKKIAFRWAILIFYYHHLESWLLSLSPPLLSIDRLFIISQRQYVQLFSVLSLWRYFNLEKGIRQT